VEQVTVVPKVSICSQIRNQVEWAKEMIASVRASTRTDWELIIVDDASTENLKGAIEAFNDDRIKYIRFDEHVGVPTGTNHAMKQARGTYICMIAADETITPEKLAQQTEYLDSHPGVDCIWGLPGSGNDGKAYPMGERPEWEQYAMRAHNRSNEAWLRTLLNLEQVPIGGASLMMKRSVMESLGYQDEKLTCFSDHELYCRFFSRGHVGVVLPYRWAMDKPASEQSVRAVNAHKAKEELAYVREKHQLQLPPADGKVTVGIPCYNHARFLKATVDSVLAQTRPVDEILILDDFSTDDFKAVVQQFTDPRIKVLAFDENRGMQEAVNQMAFRARGDFFIPLSADDTLAPNFVERCLAEFAANPWLEFVASQTDFLGEDGKPFVGQHPFMSIPKAQNRDSREEWLAVLHGGNQYFGAGMYRTYAISQVGGWEKQYKVISDYQMYLKLLQRENIKVIEEPLTHTRIHGKNDSLLDKKRAAELPWLYAAARKRFYRKLMKVVIATPFYEVKAFSPYIVSLIHTVRMLTAVGIDWHFMELSGDSYVHRARNTMADRFLADPDATDLFYIDSDMSWNPDAFVKMCMLPDDVVGGSYPVKNAWDQWTSIPKLYLNGNQNELHGRDLGDGTALIEAQVLAGGFLRIKRHVLERYRDHYPNLSYVEPSTLPDEPEHKFTQFFAAESIDGKFYGEDHWFARRLRDMGMTMFIYPNVEMVHWGYKDFKGNYDTFLKQQRAAA
jgi:glycosyltransferase involved in cell wall biosynthesis